MQCGERGNGAASAQDAVSTVQLAVVQGEELVVPHLTAHEAESFPGRGEDP